MKRNILPTLFVTSLTLATVACSSFAADQLDNNFSLAPPVSPLMEGKAIRVVPHPDHSTLLRSSNPQLAANKRLVYDLWRTVLNAGHVEAADDFLTSGYIQHNPTVPTGRAAFKAAFASFVERLETIPETVQDPLVTIVAEGDYVVMAFVTEYPEPDGSGDTYTSTHFDLFRIENGRIAEHWDSVQLTAGIFPPSVEDGGPLPIVGTSGLDQLAILQSDDPALANNKRLVFDIWRHIPEAGREEIADLYLDPIYIQHNPNATTGRDGFKEYFSLRPDSTIDIFLEDPIVAVVAEGNLVVQILQEERPHPDKEGEMYYIAWFDMFRIEDGRAIEHWDTASKGELPAVMQGLE